MKETRRLRERALAAAVAWAIAGMAPARAVPAPEREWSVAVQCFEVAAGGRSTVWGYAIAVGPAIATRVTCRIEGVVGCSVAMPGQVAACSGSQPSGAAASLPALVCGEGWAAFTDGTVAEARTC